MQHMPCIFTYNHLLKVKDSITVEIPTTEEDVTNAEADTTSLRNLGTTTYHESVTLIQHAGSVITSDAATTEK